MRADLQTNEAAPVEQRAVRLPIGGVELEGSLSVPTAAHGIVLFAHGSGSGRLSPRNRFVAEALQGRGLATLLFDLLTAEEEARDSKSGGMLRFDTILLATRLLAATDWLEADATT